jgi:hypothetical protein
VSPILMRPVREQLEHDRVIRLLQAKYRRRHQVAMNVGSEQAASVPLAGVPVYPDLVLTSNERGHRVEGVVEVETAESVNNMEALAEWAPFGRLRSPFYLYIPNGSVDTARRLIAENQIEISEVWSYYLVGDQMRFAMVYKAPVAVHAAPRRPAEPPRRKARPRGKSAARRPAKPARKARAGHGSGSSSPRSARGRTSGHRSAKKAARPAARTQKRK